MLSNVADLFGNISDRNLNYKQKNAIVDSKMFCKDKEAGFVINYKVLTQYGLANSIKDGIACPIEDLGGIEILDALFGLNLARQFKLDEDFAGAVKLSKAKVSEEDELAQAIKLSKLSAQQQQQEDNELAEAFRLNTIEAANKNYAQQKQLKEATEESLIWAQAIQASLELEYQGVVNNIIAPPGGATVLQELHVDVMGEEEKDFSD